MREIKVTLKEREPDTGKDYSREHAEFIAELSKHYSPITATSVMTFGSTEKDGELDIIDNTMYSFHVPPAFTKYTKPAGIVLTELLTKYMQLTNSTAPIVITDIVEQQLNHVVVQIQKVNTPANCNTEAGCV